MYFSRILLIPIFVVLTTAMVSSCKHPKKLDETASNNVNSVAEKFPGPTGYVNDYENLFSVKEKEILENLISDYEKKTTVEIAVITFDTAMLGTYSVDSFTLAIGKKWGVGKKDKNNGIVIGICSQYRKIRIENGYGIQNILSNAETKELIDTSFIPFFKNDDYFKGTLNGLKALMAKLNLNQGKNTKDVF
jgi:uncharacterized protein